MVAFFSSSCSCAVAKSFLNAWWLSLGAGTMLRTGRVSKCRFTSGYSTIGLYDYNRYLPIIVHDSFVRQWLQVTKYLSKYGGGVYLWYDYLGIIQRTCRMYTYIYRNTRKQREKLLIPVKHIIISYPLRVWPRKTLGRRTQFHLLHISLRTRLSLVSAAIRKFDRPDRAKRIES